MNDEKQFIIFFILSNEACSGGKKLSFFG